MSKTLAIHRTTPTAVQAQFEAAFRKGDFAAMVELARPLVAQNLFTGGFQPDDLGIGRELVGDLPPAERGVATTVDWDTFCRRHAAALAIGVALGQLVDREVIRAGAR